MELKIVNISLLIVVLTNSSSTNNNITTSPTNRISTSNNITTSLTNSSNITSSSTNQNRTKFVVTSKYITNLTVISFALLVNIAVLLLSTSTWRISTHYKLTTCLAISDALYCAFFLLNKARYLIDPVNPSMAYRNVCLLGPTLVGTAFLDIGFIVLLAIERYVSICHPWMGGLKMKYVWSMVFENVFFYHCIYFALHLLLL